MRWPLGSVPVSEDRGGVQANEPDADYDVVIVGASIAGCTAATLLGRQGARVALLERSPDPDAYKVICTHAILACATPTLRRLGLVEQIEAAGGLRNHGEFWSRYGWACPEPPAGVEALPYGYNIRRERLDPMMRSLAAGTEGVDFVSGATVVDLLRDPSGRPDGVRVTMGGETREVRARVVIGADGRDSKVARLAGLRARVRPNARFIYFAHYKNLPTPKPIRIWNLEADGAATFANDDGITLVNCAAHKNRLAEFREDLEGAYMRFIASVPGMPDLATGERVTKIMGRLEMSNLRRHASAPGIGLIGDAAQASDPLWGVGCGWALESGEWLADALDGSLGTNREIDRALEGYRRRHRRQLAAHHWMIADYSTGRSLRPTEKLLLRAAVHDQEVARALHKLINRMATPQRIFTPALIARAAWANVRAPAT
jgi:menaquinone-9 beta-reductase